MVSKPYYLQNGGKMSSQPPKYLGKLAKECWKKVVPFLDSTNRVERIDTSLVEQYCTQYEVYRTAYDEVQAHGIQTAMYKTLQNQMGEKIGKDFVGYKKNPAVLTMKDASNQLNSIGGQLGLSPKARQELMSIVNKEEGKTASQELADFFKK